MIEDALVDGEMNPRLLEGLPFRHSGINFCNKTGAGSVPHAANVGYMGAIVMMKPSVFLSIVPDDGIDMETVDYLAGLTDPLIGSPFLDVNFDTETGLVGIKGHEGRSRMTFIGRKNYDEAVPVVLFLREDNCTLRARHIEDDMLEKIMSGVVTQAVRGKAGRYVGGPIFEQGMYLDKDQIVRQVKSMEPSPALSR